MDHRHSPFIIVAALLAFSCGQDDDGNTQSAPQGSAGSAGSGGSTSSSGSGGGVAGGSPQPGAPVFLSFGMSTATLTQGESVTFTAVLTDPDGIDDLIGGTLKSPDGVIHYGAFATSGQEGAYALTLSWDQIGMTSALTFASEEIREFEAEFFDATGGSATRSTTLDFYCDGWGACEGDCRSYQQMQTELCEGYCDEDVCAGEFMECLSLPEFPAGRSCRQECESIGRMCTQTCKASPQEGTQHVGVFFDALACGGDPVRFDDCDSEYYVAPGIHQSMRCCCI